MEIVFYSHLSLLEVIIQRKLQFSKLHFGFGGFGILVVFHVDFKFIQIGLHLRMSTQGRPTGSKLCSLMFERNMGDGAPTYMQQHFQHLSVGTVFKISTFQYSSEGTLNKIIGNNLHFSAIKTSFRLSRYFWFCNFSTIFSRRKFQNK